MAKLILPHDAQDIALVFLLIHTLPQNVLAIFLMNPRIMTCCKIIRAESKSILLQEVKTNMAIAFHAGIWRETITVRINEKLHHSGAKDLFGIENVKGNTNMV